MVDKTLDKINTFVPEKWRWVLQHGGFRKYFKNTGWMFLGQMASLVVSFFVGVWIARYLGPDDYGILNYSLAYVGLFGFIASLGIDGILNRELIINKEKENLLLGTAFRLKLIGGIASLVLIVISLFFFNHSLLINTLILIYSIIFVIQSINIISIFFQANVQAKNNIKAQILALIISSILKIFIIIFQKGVIWLISVYVLDALIIGLGLIYFYYKNKLKINTWRFDKRVAKNMLSGSWLLVLASASSYIFTRIDQLMINYFLGHGSVGLYAASIKIVEIFYFIPGLICASVFPAILNAKNKSQSIYLKRLKSLFIILSIMAMIIILPLFLFSKTIIQILFGMDYFESIRILKIYSWSSLGFFISWVYYNYLLSENKLKKIFIFYFILMTLNVCLNFILIQWLGLDGAAYSTLISLLLIPIIFLFFEKFKNSQY